MSQAFIFVPIIGFALAAGVGVFVRAHRARADKYLRESLSIVS